MFRMAIAFAFALVLGVGLGAAQPIRVVCTNTDLAAIAQEIGGNLVDVTSLVPSQMQPHSMPLRPSLLQKLRQARLLITIGLDHEPWLFDAVTSSGNGRVVQGGAGYVDVSAGIRLAQVPTGSVDRTRGDLHIFGNTHYWLDPNNGKIIAVNILQALSRELPAHQTVLRDRTRALLIELDQRIGGWKRRLAPYAGTKVVSYHLSWPYLEAFGNFRVVGTLEIKPGIEPSPAHLGRLQETMRAEKVRTILMEPYYNRQRGQALADQTGAKVVVIQPSTPEGQRYADHIGRIVDLLEGAFRAP